MACGGEGNVLLEIISSKKGLVEIPLRNNALNMPSGDEIGNQPRLSREFGERKPAPKLKIPKITFPP
jgi:hypothetical protein